MHQLNSELNQNKQPVFTDINLMSDSGFIRLPQVKFLYGVSSATIWRMCQSGKIPSPVKISERCTGWNVSLIKADLLAKAGA